MTTKYEPKTVFVPKIKYTGTLLKSCTLQGTKEQGLSETEAKECLQRWVDYAENVQSVLAKRANETFAYETSIEKVNIE